MEDYKLKPMHEVYSEAKIQVAKQMGYESFSEIPMNSFKERDRVMLLLSHTSMMLYAGNVWSGACFVQRTACAQSAAAIVESNGIFKRPKVSVDKLSIINCPEPENPFKP